MTYVLWPEDEDRPRDLGGKARALADLQRARLPIPAWFVLSPDAFYSSLTIVQRMPLEARDVRTAATAMRGEIRLDPAPLAELSAALATLCPEGEPVAVRSSAVDEDGTECSFAGQFDSFLFVPSTPEAVVERVAAVWRSAFSPRVLAYREQNGLPEMPRPPSVLIQRMVNADRAGVAFGADPVSGRRGVVVVAAVWGLGTSLVSGECDADTYHVDRDGVILLREIADKRTAHCAAPETPEGVEAVAVPDSEATRPVLADDQIRAVAELARRAGSHGGGPRDIEWAIEAGQLSLLQSRPITALAGRADPDGALNIWDNSNIAESYNGVTTPLTFSFAARAYTEVYRQMCRTLGVSKRAIEENDNVFRHMLGLIRGRVYYNLLNWYRLLVLLPGYASNRAFMEQMMGVREPLPEEVAAGIGPADGGAKLLDSARMAFTFGGILLNYVRLPARIRGFHAELNSALADPNPPLDALRTDELGELYRKLEQRLLTHWDPPLVNDLFAMIFYGQLGKLTAKYCGDVDGTLRNDLVRGAGGMISAEPAIRVREMAKVAFGDPELAEILRTGSVAAAERAIELRPEFTALYNAYLDKFGDRCLEELKLESETLHDDPTSLLRAVGRLAGGAVSTAPTAVIARREEQPSTPAANGDVRTAHELPNPKSAGSGKMQDVAARIAQAAQADSSDAACPEAHGQPSLDLTLPVSETNAGTPIDLGPEQAEVDGQSALPAGTRAVVADPPAAARSNPWKAEPTETEPPAAPISGPAATLPGTAGGPVASAKPVSGSGDAQSPGNSPSAATALPASANSQAPPVRVQTETSIYRPDAAASASAIPADRNALLSSIPMLQRPLFHWVLRNARDRVRDRENLRFERTRLFGRVRRIFVEIGTRFAADGLLDSPRDIFYLEVDEVLGFISGTASCTDLKALVALRRAEFDAYRSMPAPADRFETRGVVYGGNTFESSADTGPAEPETGDRRTLKGLACCPGVVRARVRLILDPHGAEISPGSILVAERTDPGWVMLFPAAAGLLVERGSLLSHSAIVAREMGIPAIVAIPGLTQRIADGALVEMDGSTGIVRILNEIPVSAVVASQGGAVGSMSAVAARRAE